MRVKRDRGEPRPLLEELLSGDLAWVSSEALCAQTDAETFHPEKGGSSREAKVMCNLCPLQAECLEYALVHNMRFGVWGGASEPERRLLLKRRGAA